MPIKEKILRIISIEDSPADCELIVNELGRNREIVFTRVNKIFELKDELSKKSWDLVISDHNLTKLSTLEALRTVREFSPTLPFILFSGRIGEEIVVDLMKAGIQDVIMKSRPERLLPAVNRALKECENRNHQYLAKKMANEAVASKEQMLAIVSHDIKNPLFAIQLEAQMLLRAVERSGKSLLGEEVKIQAGRILKTTERMKGLITDLLDKNKSENVLTTLHRIDMDAVKVMQEALDAVRPLLHEKEILVKIKLPEKNIIAYLDRNKMFQVFANLLNNAIKFTPPKGNIQIIMDDYPEEFVFKVIDSGPGLPELDIAHVFDKYWTGENQKAGTGLGLYICKTIVEAHSGHITAENHVNGGASFWFVLPKEGSGAKMSPASPSDVLDDQKKKIYIVDDDEDLREVMSWALRKEGFAIQTFQSPKDALWALNGGRAGPHLIVIDFHMEGMKGDEFLNRKNEISHIKDCPVLMISAAPQEIFKSINREFYKEVIPKPIDLEGLVDNIKKHLA